MQDLILANLNLYVWAKDCNFRYLYCNENYARAAGLESPADIIGRKDDEMPWAEQADFFRCGDKTIFEGSGVRVNVQETLVTLDKVADTLVSESQLLNANGNCIGLVGSSIDITGRRLEKKSGYYNAEEERYYLGESFNNTYLTLREIQVLRKALLGYTARQAAESLNLSPKTVEAHIEHIKLKLQATSKGEMIATAIQFGLTQVIALQQCLPKK